MRWDRFFGSAFAAALLLLACADPSRAGNGMIALKPPPADPHATVNAAIAALRDGQPALARQLDEQALAMPGIGQRDSALALLNRGLAQEQEGDHAGAIADFTAALHLGVLKPGERAHALFDRGVSFDQIGRMDEALADYSAALALLPRYASALNNRANIYRRMGRLAEAKADYEASLAAGNPQAEYCYYGLGQVAEAEDEPEAARDYYRHAVAVNGEYRLAVQRLAALGDPWTAGAIVLTPPSAEASPSPDPVKLHPPEGHVLMAALPLRPAILGGTRPRLTQAAYHPSQTVGAVVQLGSWRDEADAARGWNALVSDTQGLLESLTPNIVAAEVPGRGRFYRLRVTVADRGAAAMLCGQLKARDLACLPVRD